MKTNDLQTWLTNVTLDAYDVPNPVIKVYSIKSRFSGWFGFGQFLGYQAIATNGLRWMEGDIRETPSQAVRSAAEKLITFDNP